MNKYYIVYDHTPYDQGKDYIQIGLGEKSLVNLVGEAQYDKEAEVYNPETSDKDVSESTDEAQVAPAQ